MNDKRTGTQGEGGGDTKTDEIKFIIWQEKKLRER